MKMAVPCPVLTLCKHIPHRFLEGRKLDLKREKVEGDRGDDGLERCDNLELILVLHWSFGLSGTDGVGTVAVPVVRQRRLGLETGCDCSRGVEGLEKNPNLEPSLGLGLTLFVSTLSLGGLESRSREMDVQNARRHPTTIFSQSAYEATNQPPNPQVLLLSLLRSLSIV